MSEYLPGIVWLVVLLAANAFFVGAEFAVVSARRSQIEPKAAEGNRAAQTTLWAIEHATLMLATSQLGITVCSLLILTVSEPAIHHLLEIPLGATDLSPEMISVGSFVIALVLVTYLHVVFGEMVPKNLSFSVPDRAALILAPPLVWVSKVVKPIIYGLNHTANGVLRLFRVEPKDEANATFTLEEVASIIEQSQQEGTLTDTTGTLKGAFEFTDKSVAEVAVPLSELVVLDHDVTPRQLQHEVHERGYSRYVIADESGEPSTYLHMKDVMDLPDEKFDDPVPAKRLRRLISVPETSEIENALTTMRSAGAHIARTVDDQGRITGALFLEDVLEVLIGEVNDITAA